MIKFSFKSHPAIANYWGYCQKNQIPHIEISEYEDGYMDISYDLLPCLPFHRLDADLSDEVFKIYEAYFKFFNLPDENLICAGGTINLSIKVRNEHAEFIAEHLFDYLTVFVSKHRTVI